MAFQQQAESLSDVILGLEEAEQIRRRAAAATPR
jgi:hypothetical protein